MQILRWVRIVLFEWGTAYIVVWSGLCSKSRWLTYLSASFGGYVDGCQKWMRVRGAWKCAWSRGSGPTKHVRRKGGYSRNAKPLKARCCAGEAALGDVDTRVLLRLLECRWVWLWIGQYWETRGGTRLLLVPIAPALTVKQLLFRIASLVATLVALEVASAMAIVLLDRLCSADRILLWQSWWRAALIRVL
jgi:hypothetical protein